MRACYTSIISSRWLARLDLWVLGALVIGAGAFGGPLLLDLAPLGPGDPIGICANYTAPCLISGCVRDETQPVPNVVCCKEHSTGRGCCTYQQATGYKCMKNGQWCQCSGVYDVSGPCSNSGQADPAKACNTTPCSPDRGRCM